MATISGKWQWNSTISFTGSYEEMHLTFTSNGETFDYLSAGCTTNLTFITYINKSNDTFVTAYNNGTWNNNDAYRIMDFGTTAQSCDDAFYNEFTSNASEYVEYGYLKVYSNDGSSLKKTISIPIGDTVTFTVKSGGFSGNGGGYYYSYTYSGNKTFLGIATSANATTPTYAVGNTFSWTSSSSGKKVYIVEEDTQTSSVKITYDGEVIATVTNGQTVTLSCAGKLMQSDIVVTVN